MWNSWKPSTFHSFPKNRSTYWRCKLGSNFLSTSTHFDSLLLLFMVCLFSSKSMPFCSIPQHQKSCPSRQWKNLWKNTPIILVIDMRLLCNKTLHDDRFFLILHQWNRKWLFCILLTQSMQYLFWVSFQLHLDSLWWLRNSQKLLF